MSQKTQDCINCIEKSIQKARSFKETLDHRTHRNKIFEIIKSIGGLVETRDALIAKNFENTVDKPVFTDAINALQTINNTILADLNTHEKQMRFVQNVAIAGSAVFDLAIAAGAFV